MQRADNAEAHATLDMLSQKECAEITAVTCSGTLKKKFMEMGIIPKTEICFIQASPFGDPIEYKIRGYRLSLRKSEAKNIEISNIRKYA